MVMAGLSYRYYLEYILLTLAKILGKKGGVSDFCPYVSLN
jgi:hypothetical protein